MANRRTQTNTGHNARRGTRRGAIVTLAALTAMALTGCATLPDALPPAPRSSSGAAAPYLLQPGDIVELHTPLAPDLDEQVAVGPDGTLTFHYSDVIQASGRTLPDVTEQVREKYCKDVLECRNRTSDVKVTLRNFVGTRIYVFGEVATPSEIVSTGQISAVQAIARAGGLKITAQSSQALLVRRDAENKPHVYAIEIARALNGRDPGADVLLQPLDIVYVPRGRLGNVSLAFEFIRNALPFSIGTSFGLSTRPVF
jgi:protein involved in polysaccharide export with SLBB domain